MKIHLRWFLDGCLAALGHAARTFQKGQDTLNISTVIVVEGVQQLVTLQVDSIEVADYSVNFVGAVEPVSQQDSFFVEEIKYSIPFHSVTEFSYSESGASGNGSKQSFKKTWHSKGK